MPVDFQDVRRQVNAWGENAPLREAQLRRIREECLALMSATQDLGALRAKAFQAAGFNPSLRTALPLNESLDAHAPAPPLPAQVTVLAADGSQIIPDRHAALEFCVINVGAFEMRPGQPEPPAEHINTHLLTDEELYTSHGMITDEFVAVRRDLKERQFISELARSRPAPLVSLTDGPLELFRDRQTQEDPEFKRLFADYIFVLREIAAQGVLTAGYVDKPHGDLLVRLLEIARLPAEDLKQAGKQRPFIGLTDANLLRACLAPGERSAVFGIQSPSARFFEDELELHFFYLNVGRPGHPWLARVEIPAWIAQTARTLDLLHAVLVSQCRILGTRPYPYVLHRAHEVAVVTLPEKEQVELLLLAELRRRGLEVGEKSHKQAHKDGAGRTKHHL